MTVTYHDACHLVHGQRSAPQPRELLRRIPGLTLVELADSELCCGSAGVYNLLEPEMAGELGRRKAARIRETGARVVAAGNPGCLMQIASTAASAGLDVEVVHPVTLLARALGESRAMKIRRAGSREGARRDKMAKIAPRPRTARAQLDLYCVAPGQSQKPHRHEGQDKIYYVLEGTRALPIGGRRGAAGGGRRRWWRPPASSTGWSTTATALLLVLVLVAPPPPHMKREGPMAAPSAPRS